MKKNILESVINKYYLGVNDSVKWDIFNNTLEINFISPTKDIIGKITCTNIEIEDSSLAIYDTKKLLNFINICEDEINVSLISQNKFYTKIKLKDNNYNLTYVLSDPLLIQKVPTVTEPEWDIITNLTNDDITKIIKAKNAISEADSMKILVEGNNLIFMFGIDENYNNKILYNIPLELNETNIELPFNANQIKNILNTNKDVDSCKLYISGKGIIKFEFKTKLINSMYYIVRKTETEF